MKKIGSKSIILISSLVLLLTLTVGGTVAFLLDTTEPVKNIFTASKVTTEVDEYIKEPGVKKNVKIKNTGDTEAYIRAAVIVTWQDDKGNVYGEMPVLGTDYTMEYDLKSGWIKSIDGFYYWNQPVSGVTKDKEGKDVYSLTGVLIEECCPITGKNPEGYFLNVEIIGSGIQSVPTTVVTKQWSSGVNGIANDEKTLLIKTDTSGTGN